MNSTDFQNGFALGMASGGVVEVVPEELLATKQDTLVSGENIKTINGQSILGEGDISISGGSDYTLPVGGDELGGVKNGGNVVINEDGTMNAPETEVTDEQVEAVSYKVTEVEDALAIERARINNIAQLPEGSTTGDAELVDARVDNSGGVHTNVGEHIRNMEKNTANDIDALKSLLYTEDVTITETTADNTLQDTVYSSGFKNGTTLNNYTTYEKNVTEGEKYLLSASVPNNNSYAVALFFNESGYISGQGFNVSGELMVVKDYEVTIPKGCTIMRTSQLKTTNYAIKKKDVEYIPIDFEEEFQKVQKPIAYRLSDGTIEVCSKYGRNKDLKITLKQKGGNNLFDFYEFSIIDNETDTINRNFEGYIPFNTSGTDWFAPFKIKALNNIDGDNLTSEGQYNEYFTGGNHQYNNTGSGSSATARLDNLRFFVDGREVTSGTGAANIIEIRWTNFVQAYNTTKSNGSGREVLQENHTLRFDGVEWLCDVELIPLEDVNIKLWYGFQANLGLASNVSYNRNVRYVNSANRGVYNALSSGSECGSKNCSKIICCGDEHCLEIEVDESYDLGKREYLNVDKGGFVSAYNKAYHNIIYYGLNCEESNRYYLRGKYRFYPV